MNGPRHRLRLVAPEQELSGALPKVLERAAKLAQPGDATHRGLIFVGVTLAQYALRAAIVPGARSELSTGLTIADAWARGAASDAAVKKARSEAFQALPAIEQRTVEAVRRSSRELPPQRKTQLDPHAEHVVLRYAGLAAYYAAGAVLLTLDATLEPVRILDVIPQIAGARAYQLTGLGAARSGEFRARAWEQAEWETERQAASAHDTAGLALQLFHEFLGVRWREYDAAERAYLTNFAEWGLASG